MLRQGLRGHGRFGDQGQRALGARQQLPQVEVFVAQHASQVIAAAVDEALRLMVADRLRLAREQVDQPPHELAAARGGVRAIVVDRFAADFEHLAVGEHDLQAEHVGSGRAVLKPMAAAGVDRDHAAHRGHAAHGRVGTEMASHRPQEFVEVSVHDPRLDAHAIALHVEHAAHVAREVEHQPGAERFARKPGARAAREHRQVVFGGVLDAGHDVGQRARPDHGQGPDFVDAGVAGVELQEDVVAADVAFDESAQIVLDSFPVLVHA